MMMLLVMIMAMLVLDRLVNMLVFMDFPAGTLGGPVRMLVVLIRPMRMRVFALFMVMPMNRLIKAHWTLQCY